MESYPVRRSWPYRLLSTSEPSTFTVRLSSVLQCRPPKLLRNLASVHHGCREKAMREAVLNYSSTRRSLPATISRILLSKLAISRQELCYSCPWRRYRDSKEDRRKLVSATHKYKLYTDIGLNFVRRRRLVAILDTEADRNFVCKSVLPDGFESNCQSNPGQVFAAPQKPVADSRHHQAACPSRQHAGNPQTHRQQELGSLCHHRSKLLRLA